LVVGFVVHYGVVTGSRWVQKQGMVRKEEVDPGAAGASPPKVRRRIVDGSGRSGIDIMDIMDIVDIVDIVDIADIADIVDIVDIVDEGTRGRGDDCEVRLLRELGELEISPRNRWPVVGAWKAGLAPAFGDVDEAAEDLLARERCPRP
jgi:hypothetical protein